MFKVSFALILSLGLCVLHAQTNEPGSTDTSLSATNAPHDFAVTNAPSPIEEAPLEEPKKPNYWPISLQGEVGTTGMGGSASWRFADHFGIHGGMNYFGYWYSGDIEDVRYESDVRLLSETVALDFYPIKKLSFKISVGALFNQNQLTGSPDPTQSITIDGVTYTPAEYGTLNLKIKQQPVNPYISISGNFFCFDRGHHWSLGGELGVAYSPWDVSLNHTGGTNPPGLDQAIADQKQQIDDKLNRYPLWPILKLYVTCAF